MDKLNFVGERARKLPLGFRFQPTDEEIVFQYLTPKIFSTPLPASAVPDISLSEFDPWDLPGDASGEEDRYFFTKKEGKYQNGNRTNRTTSSGYWKATGSDKRITSPKRKDLVGKRKTLVFHRGKPPNGSKTVWIMHEYRLVNSGETQSCNFNSTQNTPVQVGNWVLCRIFLKKPSVQNDDDDDKEVTQVQPRGYDLMVRDLHDSGPTSSSCSSTSSSCGSSVINEVTSNGC